MNKKRLAIIIIIAAVVLALIGFLGYTVTHDGNASPDQENSVEGQVPGSPDGAVSPPDGTASPDGAVSSPSDSVYQLDPDAGIAQTDPAAGGTAAETQKALRADTVVNYYGSVPNDITGKMRCSGYSSGTAQEDLALDYYKAFFGGDDEIHALINYAAGNTARITVLDDNTLDVTIMEHIDGEEQNADTLCNGRILAKFYVYKDSGEKTEVHPD